jgi:hypothetical protein
VNYLALLVGVSTIGVGIYIWFRPMAGLWVSGREWQRSPEAAEQKQRRIAKAASVTFLFLGLVFIVIGMSN